METKKFFSLVIKTPHDTLFYRSGSQLRCFVNAFGKTLKLDALSHELERFLFYGLYVMQHKDYLCSVHRDGKQQFLGGYLTPSVRRRQGHGPITDIR